jgi:hypothetical protein
MLARHWRAATKKIAHVRADQSLSEIRRAAAL